MGFSLVGIQFFIHQFRPWSFVEARSPPPKKKGIIRSRPTIYDRIKEGFNLELKGEIEEMNARLLKAFNGT